ncbi:Ribosomal protein S9 [Elusimicrobium minutum Pei191]|uniref:Small ribosomal subunit protein uS9 n=1 Tax=Elusimicrobium minutum (strain Pei191) TaxID=445932 RepID=B2KEZ6_ELUMP|nr:30S ribosomal protein S9 [Elusimicrobium minutum]ACC99092.1 Ribosomal protein S9 [Elusimicrobium minutum Pei191]
MTKTKTSQVGRRKTSIATAELIKGKGKITVNAKPMEEYFVHSAKYQKDVKAPLTVTNTEKEYDVIAKVQGGGVSSQAGAIRHAIARSLAAVSEDFKKAVKKAGYLTRDPRMVERKKPGQPGARKRFQFSKR